MSETRTVKQVCKCENCGNEAEMVVTCQLVHEAPMAEKAAPKAPTQRAKGVGVCTHCGNEADMWVDL